MGTIPAGESEQPRDSGTNERRVSLRRSVVDSHLITVDLAFQNGALLLDLSETGMGVQALASAPTGTTTPLRFELPETGGRVEGLGRIAWTDSSGRLGIQFEEVAEMSRLHLAQWLSRDRRPLVAPGPHVTLPSWPPAHMRDEIAALRRDLAIEKLEGDAALAFMVERMRNVTRATGAVIALQEGPLIVCRASSGNAPGVGAHVDPNSGLSGECIRTGEIVRCEDTETDPRADRLVCRRLELRSMVIVPVRVHGRPAGLLEVFSSRAHAFQSSDVLLLRRICDLVAAIAVPEPQPVPLPASPGPEALMAAALSEPFLPEPPAQAAMPPMMDEILDRHEDETAPPPVVTKSPAPKSVVQPEAKPNDIAVEVARAGAASEAAAPIQRAVPAQPRVVIRPEFKPAREEPRESTFAPAEATAEPLAIEQFVAAATVSIAPKENVTSPSPSMRAADFARPQAMAAAAAAAATVRAPFEPQPARRQEEELPERSEFEPELADETAEQPAWTARKIAVVGILAAVIVVGGWKVWRVISPPPAAPINADLNRGDTAALPATPAPLVAVNTTAPAVTPAAPLTVKPQPAGGAAKPASAGNVKSAPRASAAEEREPEPIALAPPNLAKAEAEAPPPISVTARSDPPAISNLLRTPIAAPTLDTTHVSQLTGGKLLKKYDPVYPPSASGSHGEVVLKATINREGKVIGVKIISGPPLLAQAAATAVRRWRYEPFLLNGFPIEVDNTIVVNFKSSGR